MDCRPSRRFAFNQLIWHYLEKVIATAQAFVRDPAHLDWDWLKRWAGMDG
jgi:hypothetical protein